MTDKIIKTKRVSADEARNALGKRDVIRNIGGSSDAVVKAARGSASSWDKDERTVRMVMTAEIQDRYGDIVVTGGGDLTNFLKNPVAPFCHKSSTFPVGTWSDLEKVMTGRPKRLEGTLKVFPEGGPPEIDHVAFMLEHGGIRACSIGFLPDYEEIEFILNDEDEWEGGIKFLKWELLECSPCVIPANPAALAKMADGNLGLAKELIEDVLDNWVRTPAGVLLSREEYEKQYFQIVGTTKGQVDFRGVDVPMKSKLEALLKGAEEDVETEATSDPIDDFISEFVKGDVVSFARDVEDDGVDEAGWKRVKPVAGSERLEVMRNGEVIRSLNVPGLTRAQFDKAVAAQKAVDEAVAEPAPFVAKEAEDSIAPRVIDDGFAKAVLDGLANLKTLLSPKAPVVEKIEPTLEKPQPPAPPAPEAVAAARKSALETAARIGLAA